MVDFILDFTHYTREKKPGFDVFPQNAEELGILFPNYLAEMTGIGVEDLYYGYPRGNEPSPAQWTAAREEVLDQWVKAFELTKKAGGNLSADPNLRPEHMPVDQARDVLAPYLETAEEALVLTGLNDDDEAANIFLRSHGQIVVFKRGVAGASVFTQDGRFDIPGFAVSEIDPTGAGDCFNAGFIYGLEVGWPPSKAGVYACTAGALAVTQPGLMEGAP
jgi:sugar/nucleoside kinase (ribokinase family)